MYAGNATEGLRDVVLAVASVAKGHLDEVGLECLITLCGALSMPRPPVHRLKSPDPLPSFESETPLLHASLWHLISFLCLCCFF